VCAGGLAFVWVGVCVGWRLREWVSVWVGGWVGGWWVFVWWGCFSKVSEHEDRRIRIEELGEMNRFV
jgi:hypothetical protein